jgi:hypothetical protein
MTFTREPKRVALPLRQVRARRFTSALGMGRHPTKGLLNLDLGKGCEAVLAVDTGLAGRFEFRRLSDFVEHWVVIQGRINTLPPFVL